MRTDRPFQRTHPPARPRRAAPGHSLPALLCLLALLAPAMLACGQAPEENILLIIADDVGVDAVGLYPASLGTAPPTPNIDALADAGVLFEQAWSNPVCSPTRAGIYTGQPAYEHGVGWALGSNQEGLVVGTPTLPDQIGQRYSALFGKWHLGDAEADGTPNAGKALDHGFYDHVGVLGGLPRDAAPRATCSSGYFCWDKYVDGVELCQTGLESPDCAAGGGAFTRYATLDATDEAIDWIEDVHQHGEPWMAVVAYNAAHSPWEDPDAACLPAGAPVPVTDQERFHQMIECMDFEIGRLLDELDAMEALQNTTVVFVGDNGTHEDVGNGYYLTGHWKETVYQGGVHVPLIVADGFNLERGLIDLRRGGFKVLDLGRTVTAPVHTQDLFNTIIEMAGQTPFAGSEMDSVSLVPYLHDATAAAQRSTVYTETFLGSGGSLCQQAIRGARYKLIRTYDFAGTLSTEEMYDLAVDPQENSDLLLGVLTPVQVAAKAFFDGEMPHDCD